METHHFSEMEASAVEYSTCGISGVQRNSCTLESTQCLIPAGGSMNIIGALKQEKSKLQRQLAAVQGAIAALNGRAKTVVSLGRASSADGAKPKRTLSAAGRARISRAAKARWAKIKAKKAK
jgi:hypothetical protein